MPRYLPQQRKPPSQGWRTFLRSHLREPVAVRFPVAPTATFRVLFLFVVPSLERRKLLHLHATAHPTAQWTALQRVEALPWETTARYGIRERDRIFRTDFQRRVAALGLNAVLTAPRSPWQNATAERFIGSLRRERPDHVIILHGQRLHRILVRYSRYSNRSRTHLALAKEAPNPRRMHERRLREGFAFSEVSGLHHRYFRRAA